LSVLDYQFSRSKESIGEIILLKRKGLSIICDIDVIIHLVFNNKDTIKVSGVLNKTELLQNLLLKPSTPTIGSADIFKEWQGKWSPSFHYISASPQHLTSNIRSFITSFFPNGSISLMSIGLLDLSIFNLGNAKATREYKMSTVAEFLEKLPERRFVLIGDSTQEGNIFL
jgi:phosphatidate phosphatase APP1